MLIGIFAGIFVHPGGKGHILTREKRTAVKPSSVKLPIFIVHVIIL